MSPTQVNRPLSIVLVTPHYPPLTLASGVATYTECLAHGLAARGHRIHVIARLSDGSGGDTVEDEGKVRIHRLGPPRFDVSAKIDAGGPLKLSVAEARSEWGYRHKVARKVETLVREEGVDLVEAVDSAAEALFVRTHRHRHLPFVVRLHGPTSITERFDRNVPEAARLAIRFIERRQLCKASHVTAPSVPMADLCRREMKLRGPITVFPNPTWLEPPAPTQRAPKAKPEDVEGIKVDERMVLFVGRMVRSKGVHLIAQAAPMVLEHFPETRFVFVGSDGPARRGFDSIREQLLSLLPVRHHGALQFAGYQPPAEVAKFYQMAAVCVFPSHFEAFGYTCLEAMAHGKAVIGSCNGGMFDMLRDGAGMLYTPPEVAGLADLVVTLLSNPPLRRRLGEAARRRVHEKYRTEIVLDGIEAFYREAMAGHMRAPHGT